MKPPSRSYYESNRFSTRWRMGLARMAQKLMPDGWESLALLDVGVGDGYTIRLVKPEGSVTGIDIQSREVQLAVERGVDAQEGSALDIPFAGGTFDLVTCFEVLEHLDRPEKALAEMVRVLRPGGHIVVTAPIPRLRWRAVWWLWSNLGPGRRWGEIPHVTDLRFGNQDSAHGGLRSMLADLNCEAERTESCNWGMVGGLKARKTPGSK